MPAPRVIVVGSANTDLVIRGPRLPRAGETVLGGAFYQAAGGKGANQAVAAARAAREPVAFIAALGDDSLGEQALEGYRRENLDLRFVARRTSTATGVALIVVDEQGQNQITVATGANALLAPDDIDALPNELWIGARVLLASLESPLATVERAVERARAAGLVVVLNPAPADPRLATAPWIKQIDVLTPNCGEAAALAGLPAPDGDDPQVALEAARRLHARGIGAVVVTLGARGSLYFDGKEDFIAPRQVTAIDTTAAGDTYNGALAVALAEGYDLPAATKWATAAAAISVTRRGAQPSLPQRAEIEALLVAG